MTLECSAVCLVCCVVPRVVGPNCPDCGTRLSIVPVETAITLSALETMQLRRRQQAEFAAAESRRLSLPHHPAH